MGLTSVNEMKRHRITMAGAALLLAGSALAYAADLEVTGPDGRRILLKDDGTWRYVEPKAKELATDPAKELAKELAKVPAKQLAKEPAKELATEKPKEAGEAVLRLELKTPVGSSICRFGLRLVNNMPYEIHSLMPGLSVYRANGVMYDSAVSPFQAIKPGNSQYREVQFRGIACEEIVRIQVGGADKCVMGEYDRFSFAQGECLARIRVEESDLVRFGK